MRISGSKFEVIYITLCISIMTYVGYNSFGWAVLIFQASIMIMTIGLVLSYLKKEK